MNTEFILVEDTARGSRLRVRVTLEGVDTNEIPDSFRKRSSVYPRSFFPREMQSAPPNATGSHFFPDDLEDDGIQETQADTSDRLKRMVKVPMAIDGEGEVAIPRMRKTSRAREVSGRISTPSSAEFW